LFRDPLPPVASGGLRRFLIFRLFVVSTVPLTPFLVDRARRKTARFQRRGLRCFPRLEISDAGETSSAMQRCALEPSFALICKSLHAARS
jgi:hypothetical protein